MTPALAAEIAAAVALRDAATKGPWMISAHGGRIVILPKSAWVDDDSEYLHPREHKAVICKMTNRGPKDEYDAALIAASHTHVELIQRLAERIKELEALLEKYPRQASHTGTQS